MVQIYKASAGAGKTFVLTREYIRLLFKNPSHFRSTLAVTFTNKASAEMKQRIVSSLFDLAQDNNSPYIDFLMHDNDMSSQDIQCHARTILHEILHNYSFFFIETIDSFFQRIIRNFTKEFNLQNQYQLELRQHEVLEKAVSHLFLNLSENKEAYTIIRDFSLSKIDEEKSRNVIHDIIKYSKILFSEQYIMHASEIHNANLSDFFTRVYRIHQGFEKKIEVLLSSLAQDMQSNNLSVEDFVKKNSGFMGRLMKIRKNGIVKNYDLTEDQKNAASDVERWYAKSSQRKSDIQSFAYAGAYDIVQKTLSLLESEELVVYLTTDEILKQQYTIQLLYMVRQSLDEYTKDENLFLISHTNSLLKTLINESDAPFVYEKIGSYVHNIMIDEFQDTSRLQWDNFLPLLKHVESEQGFSLVVGDVKQSIYRFRNGDWKLLQYEIEKEFRDCITHSLQKNWRSFEHIISFNNAFFNHVPDVAQSLFETFIDNKVKVPEYYTDIFASIYADVQQEITPKTEPGGYVRVDMIGDVDSKINQEMYFEEMKELFVSFIFELHAHGYTQEDIAILTRNKKEIKQIVEFCNEAKELYPEHADKFSVVSAEALKIESSSAVQFLLACLRHIDEPDCLITQTVLLRYYSIFVLHEDHILPVSDFRTIFSPLFSQCRGRALIEITEFFIKQCDLGAFAEEVPFIHAFQEQVFVFMQSHQNSVHMFLDWWNERAQDLFISQPETKGAMQAMTIHKSKGLQFKVVIMPYVNWQFYVVNSQVTLKTESTDFKDVPVLPVTYSKKLLETQFCPEFVEETMQIFLDNINNLYVACTRAEEVLYMMYSPKLYSQVSMSKLMDSVCEKIRDHSDIPVVSIGEGGFEYGTMPNVLKHDEESVATHIIDEYIVYNKPPLLLPNPEARNFFNEHREITPRSYGLIMHKILERVLTIDDVQSAVQACVLEGVLEQDEADDMVAFVVDKIQHSMVKSWFDGTYTVLSEQSILLPHAEERRPDRIMIQGNHAVIVDYKFTELTAISHMQQVQEYMHIIASMGFEVEGYVWYVQHNECTRVSV
ncbi:MAG: UvrD-helicase domain-containing protein [Bacteroidales bacterium]